MKISTTKLQSMVAKASKGVGNNKLIPLTCLISLESKDGIFTVTTTDNTNYLYVKEKVESAEDFYVCIKADQFGKLIAKMTSEFVTLTIKDGNLEVIGNGTYIIEIPLDEMGEMIKFPNPMNDFACTNKIGSVSQSDISIILNAVKTGLATVVESYPYTNYFVGDKVVATDSIKISAYKHNLFSESKLIGANTMDLLSVVTADTVDVYSSDNKVVFLSDDVTIYGITPDGIESYSIDAINTLVEDQDFVNKCCVNKSEMLQLLDRISLFVGDYDDGVIKLEFNGNGIIVSSKQTNGEETVKYSVPLPLIGSYSCYIDIFMLQSQIKAIQSDTVNIFFGKETAIKLVDDDIVSIIALIQ